MRPLTLFFAIGIAMLFSFCSSNKYESRADYSASDSGATMTELSGDSAKLIKSAGMNFKVKDVYKSTIEISSAARSLGGLVLHSTINSVNRKSKDIKLSEDSVLTVSSYYTEASMTVRVPSPDLERFMLQVGSLATFIDQSNMDIDDRSLEFLSQELKYQSRQKIISNQSGKPNSKVKDAIVLADQQDFVIDKRIENKRLEAGTRFSTVELTLYQSPAVRKEIKANDDLTAYQLPLWKQLGDAVRMGWQVFAVFLIGLTHIWAFILLGALVWLAFRYYKNRNKKLAYQEHII